VPDGTGAYTPQRFDFCSRPYDQRVAEARELYAAAGYSAANPLNVEIRYSSGDLHNKIAIAVAALWKQSLGVHATLRGEEFRALNQAIRARTDVQVFRASWIGDYNDAWSFLQLGQSKFGINLTGYSNEEFDSLLARAATEPDAVRRRALLQKAESIFLADNAVMPLYFYVSKHLISDEVGGFGNNVLNVQYSKDMWLH
jgi:oligopeptide transport system substrate-binding protein